MDFVYWLRVFNSLLAAAVFGLCFSRGQLFTLKKARSARVMGLAFICGALAFGSTARRHEDFNPRTIMYTIGLSLCLYGMAKLAPGELPNDDNRRRDRWSHAEYTSQEKSRIGVHQLSLLRRVRINSLLLLLNSQRGRSEKERHRRR